MRNSFYFFKEWYEFADRLTDSERLSFYRAVVYYGLDEEEPVNLNGDSLKYFNEVIRPNIDKQHSKKKGQHNG